MSAQVNSNDGPDDWKLFRKDATETRDVVLPPTPPWRDFSNRKRKALTYRTTEQEVEMVNAALYLRRPLLVTGPPGVGKSSLIHAVAHQLRLGPVLVWAISSRSSLAEGLYQYDAISRLRDVTLDPGSAKEPKSISRYLRLGPLGTALYPSQRPRALLIDEIDKSDLDLPNDLLHVFEEGWFEIPELARIKEDHRTLEVQAWDARVGSAGDEDGTFVPSFLPVTDGRVECSAFPFVVLTSNKERDLPPPFLRRCLQLEIGPPDRDQLEEVVRAHFTDPLTGRLDARVEADLGRLIDQFLRRRGNGLVATDQLLNAFFMIMGRPAPDGEERERLLDSLMQHIGDYG